MRAPGICPGRQRTAGSELAQHQEGADRRLRCVFDHFDPDRPSTVFLSACSGIYKSENAGELFHKIQGIPSSARRTRVLDAGSGQSRDRIRGNHRGPLQDRGRGQDLPAHDRAGVVVNDVFVDPADSNHVLIATDRGGVLRARTQGRLRALERRNFRAPCGGAAGGSRQSGAALCGSGERQDLWRSVCFQRWGHAVGSRSAKGRVADWRGGMFFPWPRHGMERLWPGPITESLSWTRVITVTTGPRSPRHPRRNPASGGSQSPPPHHRRTRASVDPTIWTRPGEPDSPTLPLWQPRNRSPIPVRKWPSRPIAENMSTWRSKWPIPPSSLRAALRRSMFPGSLACLDRLRSAYQPRPGRQLAGWAGDGLRGLFLGCGARRPDDCGPARRNGAIRRFRRNLGPDYSIDSHAYSNRCSFCGWHTMAGSARRTLLYARPGQDLALDRAASVYDVDDLYYDAATNKVMVSSRVSEQIFAIDPKSLTWNWWQTGYRIGLVRTAGQRVVAATLYDGVVIEPQAVGTQIGQK